MFDDVPMKNRTRTKIGGIEVSFRDVELFKNTGSPSENSFCVKPKNLVVPAGAIDRMKLNPTFVDLRNRLFQRLVDYQENPKADGPSVNSIYQELIRFKYSLLKEYGAR